MILIYLSSYVPPWRCRFFFRTFLSFGRCHKCKFNFFEMWIGLLGRCGAWILLFSLNNNAYKLIFLPMSSEIYAGWQNMTRKINEVGYAYQKKHEIVTWFFTATHYCKKRSSDGTKGGEKIETKVFFLVFLHLFYRILFPPSYFYYDYAEYWCTLRARC